MKKLYRPCLYSSNWANCICMQRGISMVTFILYFNMKICGAMVIVFNSSVVDCVLIRCLVKIDYKIGRCRFSTKHKGVGEKNGWLRIRMNIICPRRTTGLHLDCYFSELALYKLTKRVYLVQNVRHLFDK